MLLCIAVKNEECLNCSVKMIRRMLGRAGLNVTTNGILLDSFFKDVSRVLLREI